MCPDFLFMPHISTLADEDEVGCAVILAILAGSAEGTDGAGSSRATGGAGSANCGAGSARATGGAGSATGGAGSANCGAGSARATGGAGSATGSAGSSGDGTGSSSQLSSAICILSSFTMLTDASFSTTKILIYPKSILVGCLVSCLSAPLVFSVVCFPQNSTKFGVFCRSRLTYLDFLN